MPPVAVEFVNASLTSQNLDDKMGWAPRDRVAGDRGGAPRRACRTCTTWTSTATATRSSTLDQDQLRFEWWTVDDLETRSPGQTRSASMAVRHGEPRLIPG